MAGLLGIGIGGTRDFSEFAARLEVAAATLPDEVMLKLHTEGDVMVETAIAAVEPFSDTIPPTIQARVEGGKIEVEARGTLAGLFEYGNKGLGGGDEFHHPVFGHKDVVVEQAMHPFLRPAMEEAHEPLEIDLYKTLDIVLETAAHI